MVFPNLAQLRVEDRKTMCPPSSFVFYSYGSCVATQAIGTLRERPYIPPVPPSGIRGSLTSDSVTNDQ